jgi:hypothetical protein
MSDGRREESDQLPEEGPQEETPEDTSGDEKRQESEENPGTPGEEGQATGNPDSAG